MNLYAIALFVGVIFSPDQISILKSLPDANRLFGEQKYAEASKYYEDFLKFNPKLGSQWRNLGICYYNLGRYKDAIECFEKAIPSYAFAGEAKLYIARSYLKLNSRDNAIKYIGEALKGGQTGVMDILHDPDLSSLAGTPAYDKLMGVVPKNTLTLEAQRIFDLDYLDAEVRRRHFFPFRVIAEAQWQTELNSVKKLAATCSPIEFEYQVQRLLTLIGDGHTSLRSAMIKHADGPITNNKLDKIIAPVDFWEFEDGVRITHASEKYSDLIGGKLLKVGTHDVEGLIAKISLISSAENSVWRRFLAVQNLRAAPILNVLKVIPSTQSIQMTIEIGGKTITRELETVDFSEFQPKGGPGIKAPTESARSLNFQKIDQPYWYQVLPDGKTMYFCYRTAVSIGQITIPDTIKKMFQEIDQLGCNRLIVDLRDNMGGSGNNNEELYRGLMARPKLIERGNLFVMMNRKTYSAAILGVGRLESQFSAITVGEPTGGKPNGPGEVSVFVLPYSRLAGSISNLYHQSTFASDQRQTFAPRIYVAPRYSDYALGVDQGLELIQQFIK